MYTLRPQEDVVTALRNYSKAQSGKKIPPKVTAATGTARIIHCILLL